MNCQVDIIVIGDSPSGNSAINALAANNPTIKLAFISSKFRSTTTRDFLNVEYIKEEVEFIDYRNRLFGCYLKNGDRIYSTHLILATGLKYEPLLVNNKLITGVIHNTDDIPKNSKKQPALVVGHDCSEDIKFALSVAKKYKQVYFCTSSFDFTNSSAANITKLNNTDNIAVLPNTSILKVTNKNNLLTVDLDNYSTITCSAIYSKTHSVPDVSFVSNKLITIDYNGAVITNKNCESTSVPKCYAVGECASSYNKKMLQLMVSDILQDFNGGY